MAKTPKNVQTLTERLRQRKEAALLRSAREKLAKGDENLTKAEEKAVANYEAAQRKKWGYPYLRAMPKGDYINYFDGSWRVNLDWRDEYGFPWPPERNARIDIVEIVNWYREQFIKRTTAPVFADTDDVLLGGASQELKDEYIRERIREKRITNQQKNLELEQQLENYVPIGPIIEAHNELAERIRKTRERLALRFDGEDREFVDRAFEDLISDYIRDVDEKLASYGRDSINKQSGENTNDGMAEADTK